MTAQQEQHYEIGMVGLGVMGRNMVLNMADHGFSVAGYDKDAAKIEELSKESVHEKVRGVADIKAFLGALQRPRAVMMLVPGRPPVDSVIGDVVPLLEKGDLIIDAGNSHFKDTDIRARALAAKGIEFLGVGVSGGEDGARHGPSIIPGGPSSAYERVRPIFEAIAAHVNGEPCVTWLGPGSAGHYVKMVHNGIEYGVMQLIAETYDLMKRGIGLNDDELHEAFTAWNNGELNGYLMEITCAIFSKQDVKTGKRLIDEILDVARQKGTGMWTSQSAMELHVHLPTIDSAVAMREYRCLKSNGSRPAPYIGRLRSRLRETEPCSSRILAERSFAGVLLTYAQGMALLSVASEAYKYHLDCEAVARIWRGGCIIRAALLDDVRRRFDRGPRWRNAAGSRPVAHGHGSPEDLRSVVCAAAKSGVPTRGSWPP